MDLRYRYNVVIPEAQEMVAQSSEDYLNNVTCTFQGHRSCCITMELTQVTYDVLSSVVVKNSSNT